MTAELLLAIAMLCQVHPSYTKDDISKVAAFQLKCQQYYVDCLNAKSSLLKPHYAALMTSCIKEARP